MRKLFETLDITYIPSSAHFPQSKSRIKTFNKCLKATLSALRLDSPELDLWTHLAKFLAVYNAQIHPHSQRGYSLSQLFFGGNHVNNSPQLQIAPPSLHFANRDAEFQRIVSACEENRQKVLSRINSAKADPPVFPLGSLVLVKDKSLHPRGKFHYPRFLGPFIVTSHHLDGYQYALQDLESGQERPDLHASHIYH